MRTYNHRKGGRWMRSFRPKRYYGFFKCDNCDLRWESSRVYEKKQKGTYWKQECKSCKKQLEPYKVENIRCRSCGNTECTCTKFERAKRHVDPNKPHRTDLCTRCRAGHPCT